MAVTNFTPRMRHALAAVDEEFRKMKNYQPGLAEAIVLTLTEKGVDFDRKPFSFDAGLDFNDLAGLLHRRKIEADLVPSHGKEMDEEEARLAHAGTAGTELSVAMASIEKELVGHPLRDMDLTPRDGELSFIERSDPAGGVTIVFASDAPLPLKRRMMNSIRSGELAEYKGRGDISFDLFGDFRNHDVMLVSVNARFYSVDGLGVGRVRPATSTVLTDWGVLTEKEIQARYDNMTEGVRLLEDFRILTGTGGPAYGADATDHPGVLLPKMHDDLFVLEQDGRTVLVALPSMFDGTAMVVADSERVPDILKEAVMKTESGMVPYKDFIAVCSEVCLGRENLRKMEVLSAREEGEERENSAGQAVGEAEPETRVQSPDAEEAVDVSENEDVLLTPDFAAGSGQEDGQGNAPEAEAYGGERFTERFAFSSDRGVAISDSEMNRIVAHCGRISKELAVKGGLSMDRDGWADALRRSGAIVPVVRRDLFGNIRSISLKGRESGTCLGVIERKFTSKGREWQGSGVFFGCTDASSAEMAMRPHALEPSNIMKVRDAEVSRMMSGSIELFNNWEKVNAIVDRNGDVTLCLHRIGDFKTVIEEFRPYLEVKSPENMRRALKGRGHIAFGNEAIDKAVEESRDRAESSFERMREARESGAKVWIQPEPDSFVVFLAAESDLGGHGNGVIRNTETLRRGNGMKQFVSLQKTFGDVRRRFEEMVRMEIGPEAEGLDLSSVQWKDALCPYATAYCVGFRKDGRDVSFSAISPEGDVNAVSFTADSYEQLCSKTLSHDNVRCAADAILEIGVEKFVQYEHSFSKGHEEEHYVEETTESVLGVDYGGEHSGGFAVDDEEEDHGYTL